MDSLAFESCECAFTVQVSIPAALPLLQVGFGAMRRQHCEPPVELEYAVDAGADGTGFRLCRNQTELPACADAYEFIFNLDKDLTLELQRRRADLLFLHGGVVERNGRALIITAASGTGKSTLTYALLHHGYRYLSDELAPIDLADLTVTAYPHALCLKSPPPSPYALPSNVLRTRRTLHVPVECLPSQTLNAAVPVSAILLIQRDANNPAAVTELQPLSHAEAAARVYTNALNPLAHAGDGLDAALHLTKNIPCFSLDSSHLSAIPAVLDKLFQSGQ